MDNKIKFSKKNKISVEKMVESFAKSQGILPAIAKRSLRHLSENKLEALSEFELALLYDSVFEMIHSSDKINHELLKAHDVIEEYWAIKAKMNGVPLTQDFGAKTLH
jgi:hypothetical protein